MTGAGFEYHASRVQTNGLFAIQTPADTIAQARARGYAEPKREEPGAGALLQKKLLMGLRGAAASSYLLALDGKRNWQDEAAGGLAVPPTWAEGCAAEATRQVLAGLPQFAPGVSDQIVGAFSRVDKSPELADAVAKWSRCMGSRGIVAGSPAEAVRLASQLRPAKTSARGLDPKSIAVADATCSADTTKRVQQWLEYGELEAIAAKSPSFAAVVKNMVSNAK
jgi:hypothetical protein